LPTLLRTTDKLGNLKQYASVLQYAALSRLFHFTLNTPGGLPMFYNGLKSEVKWALAFTDHDRTDFTKVKRLTINVDQCLIRSQAERSRKR
jgi:hypothetical protein